VHGLAVRKRSDGPGLDTSERVKAAGVTPRASAVGASANARK
jgi:hypothetical protein